MQAEVNHIGKLLCKSICKALTSLLSGACGSKWQVALAEDPSDEAPDISVAACVRCSFEGPIRGDAYLVFPHTMISALALRDVPADASDPRQAQTSALFVALQAGTTVLPELLIELGAVVVQMELVEELTLPEYEISELWVEAEAGGSSTRMSLHLCLSKDVMKALSPGAAKPLAAAHALEAPQANLDLVLDVELNVTLRFGERQLTLREVLELGSGSVVELDRQVDEPVELILDGRVLARGEAVIIDGNYGMRITQVLQHLLP